MVVPLTTFVRQGVSCYTKAAVKEIVDTVTFTEDVHLVPGAQHWFPNKDKADYLQRTLDGLTSQSMPGHAGGAASASQGITTVETLSSQLLEDDDPPEAEILRDCDGGQAVGEHASSSSGGGPAPLVPTDQPRAAESSSPDGGATSLPTDADSAVRPAETGDPALTEGEAYVFRIS